MKRRGYVAVAVILVLLLAAWIWFGRGQPDGISNVALAYVNPGTNNSAGQATFRLYNDGPRAIFLCWVVVETNTPTGWRIAGKSAAPDPRGVSAGNARDMRVSIPSEPGRWRLRVVYSNEVRGPELWMDKVEVSIKGRNLSGWGSIGSFAGSNSVVSEIYQ